MPPLRYTYFETPLGPVLLTATQDGVCGLQLPSPAPDVELDALARLYGAGDAIPDESGLRNLRRQVLRYMSGEPVTWNCPLDLRGTSFRLRVWEVVRAIPHGETRSYSSLARSLGCPRSVRAVGAANGANRVQLFIPCHRVVGANGSLVGYGGGLETKRKLLELESLHLPMTP